MEKKNVNQNQIANIKKYVAKRSSSAMCEIQMDSFI